VEREETAEEEEFETEPENTRLPASLLTEEMGLVLIAWGIGGTSWEYAVCEEATAIFSVGRVEELMVCCCFAYARVFALLSLALPEVGVPKV
jgi:hypothetical protein